MDFLAPKAKQYKYFLELAKDLPSVSPHPSCGIPIHEYPGFAYAEALCMWHEEEEKHEVGYGVICLSTHLVKISTDLFSFWLYRFTKLVLKPSVERSLFSHK